MIKKIILALLFVLLLAQSLFSQEKKPKLIVLIVCDQLAEELVLRYQPYFVDNGFNLLINRGAYFTNARYQYAYTKTGPGHATIATGAYSDLSGIVGNAWYDRTQKKVVNCVDDDSVQVVGANGKPRSPRSLQTYTAGDMLRLYTNFRSKVISVSNKDRAAILMGGKLGNAYWVDDSAFVTSTYYMKQLPEWVSSFNSSGIFQSYFGKKWDLLKPEIADSICDEDANPYESNGAGNGNTFPHFITGKDKNTITPSFYGALDTSPFGADLLLQFARKATIAETLGTRGVSDLLCVGISATDIVGHEYGPHSREVFDNLLRIDGYLADFFSFLDKQVGLYNCVIALTADHGIAPIPQYILKKSPVADAGRVSSKQIKEASERFLTSVYGAASVHWIQDVVENNIYVSHDAAKEKSIPFESVLQTLKDSLPVSFPVFASFTGEDLAKHAPPERLRQQVALSYYPKTSGDLMFVLRPYWIVDGSPTGTNHGSPWDYDTHVPLILFGAAITPGMYRNEVAPVDIAPTISSLLGVEFPPSREGRVLSEAVK